MKNDTIHEFPMPSHDVTAANRNIGLSPEKALRQNLAASYRMFAHLEMDDLTYTHLSARLPGSDAYFIYPFGQLFEEVTASSLLKVTTDGEILEGTEAQYNQTGYIIHGSIYAARPEINAIFHLHTPAGVAVSSMECGLLPISQFSLHFYNRLAYHGYDSLALDGATQGSDLVHSLATHKAMMLENHGTLTCGETLHEAFLYMYFLEQACKTQCLALNGYSSPLVPPAHVCERAAQEMRQFEPDFGRRDWEALLRIIEKKDPSFRS